MELESSSCTIQIHHIYVCEPFSLSHSVDTRYFNDDSFSIEKTLKWNERNRDRAQWVGGWRESK